MGDEAWNYILVRTGVNLRQILIGIAEENRKAQNK